MEKKFDPIETTIRVSEAYDIISQELRRHTLDPEILMSKKQKKGKFPRDEKKKDFAGSLFWQERRTLHHDHWMEFLIIGKPITNKILVHACDWEHKLGKEKLRLKDIKAAIEVALKNVPVPIKTD
jgi:hypothetical protein